MHKIRVIRSDKRYNNNRLAYRWRNNESKIGARNAIVQLIEAELYRLVRLSAERGWSKPSVCVLGELAGVPAM